MWICKKCGEKSEDQFDSCWNCSSPREVTEGNASPPVTAGEPPVPQWRLEFEIFRNPLTTWDAVFRKAAHFASGIGPERLVSISHSVDGAVAVWYWRRDEEAPRPPAS